MHFGMVCHDELVKGVHRLDIGGGACGGRQHPRGLTKNFVLFHPFEGCVVVCCPAICCTPFRRIAMDIQRSIMNTQQAGARS